MPLRQVGRILRSYLFGFSLGQIHRKKVAARTGGLIELPAPAIPVRPVWLVYPAEYRSAPRFRAVTDWLVEGFSAERALLVGGAS